MSAKTINPHPMHKPIRTKALNYNNAKRELNNLRTLSRAQCIEYIKDNIGPPECFTDITSSSPSAPMTTILNSPDAYSAILKATKETARPYNSDIAMLLLASLSIPIDQNTLDRACRLIVMTGAYRTARILVDTYEKYTREGFLSVHDLVPEIHNGVVAELAGTRERHHGTGKISYAHVTLVCTPLGDRGYRAIGQNTSYYRVNPNDDVFVRIAPLKTPKKKTKASAKRKTKPTKKAVTDFEAMKKAVELGSITIETIKAKYELTAEQETELLTIKK